MRRRMMLENGLPSGYTKLEFIYNPSSAYIDSGVQRDAYTKCAMDINLGNQSTTYVPIFGCRNAPRDGSAKCLYIQAQKFYINYGTYDGTSGIAYTLGSKSHVELINGVYTFDDKEYKSTTELTKTTSNNCGIFKIIGDTPTSKTLKLFYFKMWNGDTLIRNFIPARRKSDSVVGLYDLIGRKFYSSASNIAFQGSDETLSIS